MKETKILAGMLALILAVSVTACGRSKAQEDTPSETTVQETESTEATEAMGETELLTLEEIPDEYLASSDQPGQVVRIDYESNTYDEENRPMNKYAYLCVRCQAAPRGNHKTFGRPFRGYGHTRNLCA